jgi:GDP-D-mannose 3', 5'-epimerase
MSVQKRALVCGAGGFIGGHLVTRLRKDGYWVRGVDIKYHEYKESDADEFVKGDLRTIEVVKDVLTSDIDEVYQLAADMGGAMFVFTGENDANIMHNSALINLNICQVCVEANVKKVFFSSSACMYPERNQLDPGNPLCSENSAYPADPDSEYGWEKVFSERLFMAFQRNYGIEIHIARFHNIFGPYGTWCGGREKAPAALCRKVAESETGIVDVFGDGLQTRSFLYIDECLEGIIRLMNSDFSGPVNIGSEEMIAINDLLQMVAEVAGKEITPHNIDGPTGVRGRNSDNRLIQEKLGWKPSTKLEDGMRKTYEWISGKVDEEL